MALGGAVAVMVGQLLGAAKFEEAKDSARKLLFFSVMSCLVLGLFDDPSRTILFQKFIKPNPKSNIWRVNSSKVAALCMPMYAF